MEVVIVISLMISAVVFVATFESAPSGSMPVRSGLQQQADDALAILYDTQFAGDDSLSAFILQCMQDDCQNLTRKLDKLLPEGADYSVYMSSGDAIWPVYAPREPTGEAVTSRHLIEPSWSHTFLAPGLSLVDPSRDALPLYAFPMYKSNPLTEGGSPLLVRVHATRVSDGAEYVLTTSAATQAADASDVSTAPAVSMTFVNGTGAPIGLMDLRNATLTGGGSPSLSNITFNLRIEERANVSFPANATVSVRAPPGWLAWADPGRNPGWTIQQNATDRNASFTGSEIQAKLGHALNGNATTLTFNATYRGDQQDHYPFEATLLRGAHGRATLVVRADDHGASGTLEKPSVHTSIANPMGALATTDWTLTTLVPHNDGIGSDALDIHRVEIIESDGNAIFGGVIGASGPGAWTTTGTALTWTGSHRATHDAPLNLTFRVNASGTAGPQTHRTAFAAPVTFDNWTGRVTQQVAPGLYHATFLPATGDEKGYNGSTGLALRKSHTATSLATHRSTPLPGATTYESGYFVPLRDSTYGTYLDIPRRATPTGTDLNLTAHTQATLYELAKLGMSPKVTLRIHPPWATNNTSPIHEQTLYDGSGLAPGQLLTALDVDSDGQPGPGTAGTYNVTVPIPKTWLFGPYLLETRTSWQTDVTAVIGNVTQSETLTRTLSTYDYIHVTPPDGLKRDTPLYDVHLVTWLPDWQ